MSVVTEKSQEVYERSDLHALASQVQKNNFNIRKYNEKSSQKRHKHSMPTKYTQSSIKNRISTEPVEERVSDMSFTNTFQRVMSINEPDNKKRNRLTGSLKYRNESHGKLQAKQISQFQIHDIQFQKAKRYKQLQRKTNKGPLRKKIIQTWLNSILTQSTQFQVIDQALGNAALKKFQIDQNSLLSRGIKPENISKIYQSLFVHSIGFNNGIKQLVANNNEVAKNVWKVFSILLQYCAQGKFQTIIGVIQKEKIIKIEQLRQQVSKRQQIIQRNDQLNETKNIQIFKQIRNLTQQNINLKNQKDILFQDYQKTEQAFNQQVILRLKFENKINQLFGIHRQLAIKHQRLYDDYKKKMSEWTIASQKNVQLTQQNTELKVNVSDLTTQKQRLMSSQKYNKQLISSLKEDIVKINAQYSMAKHQYDEQRRITKQLKRRISQIQIQLENLKQIVQLKDKSWKQTHAEYQLSLIENNRLYIIISEQRTHVEELLFQKKQFNNKILNIMADASFQKRKKQQFSTLYYETDKKLKQILEKNKNLQLQIKILKNKSESFQQDLKQNYQNIKKMHEKNLQLQDELHYLRRFRASLDEVIKEKQIKTENYRFENQKLIAQNEDIKASFNKLQLNYKILKQQYELQVQNNKQKLVRLKSQYEQFQKGEGEKNRILSATTLQLQKTKKFLHNTMLDYKNQKFQRFQLKAMYEQTLGMMQKKNIQQKQLGRQISQLRDNVVKISHQRDKTAYALQNQIIRRERIQQQLKQAKESLANQIQKKSSFIHPFIYEDVAQNYRILKDKFYTAEEVIKIKVTQIKQLNEKYTSQITNLNKSYNQYFTSYKKQKQKQLYLKQSELQYERQANEGLKTRLQKLQALSQTYAKKIEERTTSEKQKLYADMIEHKTKTIEQLMEKVNIETNKNQKLRLQTLKKQAQFQIELINLKNNYKLQKTWLEQKIGDLNFQISHIKQQAERLKKQIIQTEQNFQNKLKQRMELYLQNFKKSQSQSLFEQKSDHQLVIPSLNSMNLTVKQKQRQRQRLKQRQRQRQRQRYREKQRQIQKQKQREFGNDMEARWQSKIKPQIKKRNNIAKKIRMAYDYYNQ